MPYNFQSWRYEPAAVARQRDREQFSMLRRTVSPLVQSGDSLDLIRARQATRAMQKVNAPKKPSFMNKIAAMVGETQQRIQANNNDDTRASFKGITGEDDGGPLDRLKSIGGGVLDALDVPLNTVGKPAFAIAAGQISANRKPLMDEQGNETGQFYRDKPGFLDMAQGIGSFIKDPKGAYEEGRTAFDERLANPSQNMVSRFALTGAADPLNLVGAGTVTRGLRTAAAARQGSRFGRLLEGLGTANNAIDVAPAKVLGAPFTGVKKLRSAFGVVDNVVPEAPSGLRRLIPEAAIGGGAGTHFASALRPFERVKAEVVTTDNPIKRMLIGKTGINPSVLENTETGKNLVTFLRQRVAADELSEVAVSSALDRHNPRGGIRRAVGAGGQIFDIADDGGIRNLAESKGAIWQDVFTRPDRYQLMPEQRAYVDDFNAVIDDMNFLRESEGLTPFPKADDGAFYVPRQTQSIRGVELRRPSSPKLQRSYEMAEEGVANGVRYDVDPRNTLALYTRSTYEEIAQKQLSDALEPLSVTASELVPAPVRNRMTAAIKTRQEAERAVRSERALVINSRKTAAETVQRARVDLAEANRELATVRAELRGRSQLASGRRQTPVSYGERLKAAEDRVTNARDTLAQARTAAADVPKITEKSGPAMNAASQKRLDTAVGEYEKAKHSYSRAMESARRSEIASGKIFGRNENTIAVGQWRNRFYPKEDYDRLVEVVGGFGGVARPKPNVAAKAFEGVGNLTRYAASVGDFAAPFVQGLPVLARNPVAWGKATARHYQAFLDPSAQARFVEQHLPTFQKMAQNGVPVGDVEFFKAGGASGEIAAMGRLIDKVPGGGMVTKPIATAGKQTAGRFGAAYGTFLSSARALLWESIEKGWKGTDAQLAQYMRNMTGGLDTRALAVGPNQRAVESTWLAFSPRLLRSTTALIADAATGAVKTAVPGQAANAAQVEAARTLAQLAAGTGAVYVATGLAMGKDWDEIQEGLNPLNGKRFLSYQVNGDWIGVGGQVRAITQFAANLMANPQGLADMSGDNPLIAFYMSRGAPALNTAGGLMEVMGADVLRYEDIDSLPDLAAHIGTSAMPFALQGILEGQNIESTLIGLVGGRTSPETPTDKLNAIAQQIIDPKTGQPYGKDFYDSEPRIRDLIKQKYPHIWTDAVAKGGEERQRAEGLRSELNAQQQAEDAKFLAGEVSREDWLKAYRDRQDELFYRQKEIYGDTEFEAGDTPLDRYYAERERLTDPETGRLDDAGWRGLDEWLAAQPESDQEYVNDNRGLGGTELVRAYRDVQKLQSQYYELPKYRGYTADEAQTIDALWQEARNNSRSAEPAQMLRSLRKLTQGGETDPSIVKGVRRRILGMLRQTRDRERFRKKHKELNYFYGSGPLTEEEVSALTAMTDRKKAA